MAFAIGSTGRSLSMPRVFISYRREDAAPYAGRLYDALARELGDDQVFLDIDALRPGDSFNAHIREAIEASTVVLVVIGRQWLDAADPLGERRLRDGSDIVRQEVAAALKDDRRVVVPVLVGGASLPGQDQLPSEIAPLAMYQACELRDAAWHSDVARLLEALRSKLKRRRVRSKAQEEGPSSRERARTRKSSNANASFMAPVTPSPALAALIGRGPMPRTEVTKRLWAYIKKHKLQDTKNQRMINTDTALKRVFAGRSSVHMFEMTKLVGKHLR
jgi:hypothetical protein